MDQQNNSQAPTGNSSKSSPEKHDNDLIKDLTIGLPSAIKLFEESLQLYRKKFLNFCLVILAGILPLYFLYKILELLNVNSMYIKSAFCFVFGLLSLLFLTFTLLAILFAVKDNEENISFIGIYKRAAKYYLSFWQLLITLGLILFAGFAAFIFPSIILSVWFSISAMVYMAEGARGLDALILSKHYVQGYWSSIFLKLLFLTGIIAVTFAPFVIAQPLDIPILSDVLLILALTFALPISTTFLFLIYGNLMLLKPARNELLSTLKQTKNNKAKLKLFKPAFMEGILIGLPVFTIFIYLFIFRIYLVSDSSMSPAYINKQLLAATSSRFSKVQRGRVFIFKSITNPNKVLLKRIVGLPGERIMLSKGNIYLNDKALDESSYLKTTQVTKPGEFLRENYNILIPAGHFAVFNDNREIDDDSRNWGFIRKSDLIGAAGRCLWNCSLSK